ncbi:MAG TPA: HD domain-containing phosphohydrolase [Geobacterales bacterium]|nr:HD domain-containing phosphohydrolase [Geobacterales bacterium]
MAEHVLLVDDEKNILSSLQRLLRREKIEALTATSGEEGLALLKGDDEVGVIISDQRMPGMTGVEFLEKAKDVAPDAMRIVLTGYADMDVIVSAINRGSAFRYLTKPWEDAELLQALRDGLDKYNLIRENRRLTSLVTDQNLELTEWNSRLKERVLEQTVELRKRNEELNGKNERMRKNYYDTILAFSRLIELRSRFCRNHTRNVAEITLQVARALELTPADIEMIQVAALLHDIGEIGISDHLLLKNVEEMNEDQRREYMLHTVRGQAAIDAIEDLRGVGLLIRHHHEKYDGSGNPDGLEGENIPLGARIIALADYVDRTVGEFVGDNAIDLTLDKVASEMGKAFDPQLLPLVEGPVRQIYGTFLNRQDLSEMELNPKDLRSGMALSRDVSSGSGLMLLARGTTLDESHIVALRRYYQIDPFKKGVFVLVKR